MPELDGERVHFIGAGGASMSALAEYCLLSGAEVTGSDRTFGENMEKLAALGAEVYTGARRDIIARAGVVVYSFPGPQNATAQSAPRAVG